MFTIVLVFCQLILTHYKQPMKLKTTNLSSLPILGKFKKSMFKTKHFSVVEQHNKSQFLLTVIFKQQQTNFALDKKNNSKKNDQIKERKRAELLFAHKLSHNDFHPTESQWSNHHLQTSTFATRLITILDDKSLFAISPLSAETLHFNYPFRTVVPKMKRVQLSLDGRYYNSLLDSGALVGVDCSKNPADITFKHSTKNGFTVFFTCLIRQYNEARLEFQARRLKN